ncbi:MAG: arginine--tRNA ligase [Fimbriimonadaceae bacterium]|nr:arginine--tRNA ligase [Fimbriimonadaceae bacterium]
MIRSTLNHLLADAVNDLIASGELPDSDYGMPEVAEPKKPEHGDFASAFALTAAKRSGVHPRSIAEALASRLLEHDAIESIEIAGPGFLNFRLDPSWLGWKAAEVVEGFERSTSSNSLNLNVEFVSVNPNGPITVGSGRGAAFGDTLCRVLEAVGNHVHREFYVNDGVNSEQMRLFGKAVEAYWLKLVGARSRLPNRMSYRGSYVQRVSSKIAPGIEQVFDVVLRHFELEPSTLLSSVKTALHLLCITDGYDKALHHLNQISEEDPYASIEMGSKLPSNTEGYKLEDASLWIACLISDLLKESELHAWSQEAERLFQRASVVFLYCREADHYVDPSDIQDAATDSQKLKDLCKDFLPDLVQRTFSYYLKKARPEESESGAYHAVKRIVERAKQSGLLDSKSFRLHAQETMIEDQEEALRAFGIQFDSWFREQSLIESGRVQTVLERLQKEGHAYLSSETPEVGAAPQAQVGSRDWNGSQGKALWLHSTAFGDDKDRVLVRSDGRSTYIASDIAYLRDKLTDRVVDNQKGFDQALILLGPDHHGYIGRMNAMYQALGYPMVSDRPERLKIIIFQIVRFVKGGRAVPMRKRDGSIFELKDLLFQLGEASTKGEILIRRIDDYVFRRSGERDFVQSKRRAGIWDSIKESVIPHVITEIGKDVARFFYLMRSHDTHMDFDIDLATKQSDENPVFYVQYAHARICSVIAKAEEAGLRADSSLGKLLVHSKEGALIKKILDLPHEVRRCAEDYGVHRLTTYAVELARTYHHFYDACRVIQPEQPERSAARLALCEAARTGLRATFDLLGISAPERM